MTHPRAMTPLGALARGSVAGAAGTLAMDLVLYARYRRGDGKSGLAEWELSADLENWDDAPAPAQVGKRLIEGLFLVELPDRRAALVNNVTHWGYGILAGTQYGLLAGSLRSPRVRLGAPFGAAVWATSYVVLPAAKLYEPIWAYDRRTLTKDLRAHLVYGLATAAAFAVLGRRTRGEARHGERAVR
jgi:hypothetical protein